MANKLLSMIKIRQILLFLERGASQRAIEKEVKISRKTIALYLQKFAQTGVDFQELLKRSDQVLERVLGLIGYHLELRTTYLKKLLEKNLDLTPFQKIDFLWDKTANGHPGVCLKGFEYKMKIYQLDIYYTFKDNLYDFCFYHKADNIKNRLVDETILKHLETYAFHNNYNHYHKLVLFDNIIKEINELCFNLKEIYLTIEGLLTDTSDKINH